MQSLGVSPCKNCLFGLPKLDTELGGACFPTIRRRKSREIVNDTKNCSLLMLYGNSRDAMLGTCHRRSKFTYKFVLYSEPTKGSFCSSLTATWALEPHEIGSNTNIVESNFDDVLSGFENEEEVGEEEKGKKFDVRELAGSLYSVKTADDVEEVLKEKGELPPQVYCTIIRAFGWDKKIQAAFALVEWLKRKKKETGGAIGPNLFIYNGLLTAVKQSEQYDETDKVLNEIYQEGLAPNVVTYNILMVIYVQQGKPSKALDILQEMRGKGLTPSSASYSTALLAYRRMEDAHGALKFFVEIKEQYMNGELRKHSPDDWDTEFLKLEDFIIRICYQVMRRWLVRDGNMSTEVLRLLADMDKAGLKPGQADYQRLVWACTSEKHYIVAKELYNRIREGSSDISLSVCNHVIWVMGKAKKWWAALEIYEDLLDKGPNPNTMSYELIVSHFNILLTAARRRGIWRWGIRLLNKMEDKGLKPGSKQWNAVLVACSKASETSAAVQIFRRMVEQGEKPTIISYGALLSALEKGKLYDEAIRVWDHMLKIGVKPNAYAYTIMASVFTGHGKFRMVDAIIQEMVSSGVGPTVVTYNAIISGCARNGTSSAAYEWFHRMKVQNVMPNEITYEMLIEALSKDGKPRIAYELYLRAQNEGLSLSAKAYDAVVHSSQAYGATTDTSLLGPRPEDKKKRVQIRKNLTEFCNMADVPRRSKPFDREEIYTTQLKKHQ
ncbi:hypothetical protein K2173_014287 [Erythroxylum novogranatense]|uniref:Pentatricopeptide repeat-containing protein n=1 Tax=Erythroxylum novogranatense TaxID=1862640 RepID=A0AAV8SDV1_9ROSI|nr:hypothetical protein K2173_014287 [Erythroxylum novogranatense]